MRNNSLKKEKASRLPGESSSEEIDLLNFRCRQVLSKFSHSNESHASGSEVGSVNLLNDRFPSRQLLTPSEVAEKFKPDSTTEPKSLLRFTGRSCCSVSSTYLRCNASAVNFTKEGPTTSENNSVCSKKKCDDGLHHERIRTKENRHISSRCVDGIIISTRSEDETIRKIKESRTLAIDARSMSGPREQSCEYLYDEHVCDRRNKYAFRGVSPISGCSNSKRCFNFLKTVRNCEDMMCETTLEMMGIAKGKIHPKEVVIPPRRDPKEAVFYRLVNYINPDVIVNIDQHEFFCHKILLQCYSEYFDEISGLDSPKTIEVEGVSKSAFIAIYSWMTAQDQDDGLNTVDRENILDVLIASQILKIKELEEQCLALIDSQEIFAEGNAFLLFIGASQRGLTTVMELMVPRIQNFFLVLVSSWEFIELNLEDVCTILQSNYIKIHCEFEVFMAAVRWLIVKWEERANCLSTIMKCVRFGLMTPAQLIHIKKNPESPEFFEITKDKTVQMLIEDGLAYAVERGVTGESPDHIHQCQKMNLKIPQPRNLTKKSRDYKSFSEFLEYLTQIQSHPKMIDEEESALSLQRVASCVSTTDEDFPIETETESHLVQYRPSSGRKPSLIDVLYHQKAVKTEPDVSIYRQTEPAKPITKRIQWPRPTNSKNIYGKRLTLRESAAIIIQATYRGYFVRTRILPDLKKKVSKLIESQRRRRSEATMGPTESQIWAKSSRILKKQMEMHKEKSKHTMKKWYSD